MSQDKEFEAREGAVVAPGCPTLSRRRFLQGLGATAGILAAGIAPAVLTALPASAASGEAPYRRAERRNGSIGSFRFANTPSTRDGEAHSVALLTDYALKA